MKEFIKCATIRAIRTICQAAVASIGCAVCLQDVDWVYVISASVMAGLMSLLTSVITGLPEVKKEEEKDED